MELTPQTTAALIVHLQGDVIAPDGALGDFFAANAQARNVVAGNNFLAEAVRAAGGTAVFTRVAFKPDYSDLVANCPLLAMVAQAGCLKDGSDKAELVPALNVGGSDVVITHQRFGGFTNSSLDLALRSRGITTLLIGGVATNMSVESTARQASDLGYRTIVVADACSAADDSAHEGALNNLGLLGEVSTINEVRQALQHAAEPAPTR
ncbi:cysteine hydrolase family protein [Nocardia sp. NPDC057663]|uniref:cysteine hydrolase family protein n=1 Tax=Nocardia sp. NPDC057663 TaxID=3346201 RepID=UPI00367069DD